ncbi:MAG: hypothetical protein VKJ06_03080 [Vampirovibrionales bacterium]|nr:hypothetical protein [Vampirovibrionales bacterium]
MDIERFVLFCDESIQKGEFFSNFYGGAFLKESLLSEINLKLKQEKIRLGLNPDREMKFTKISYQYAHYYIE